MTVFVPLDLPAADSVDYVLGVGVDFSQMEVRLWAHLQVEFSDFNRGFLPALRVTTENPSQVVRVEGAR